MLRLVLPLAACLAFPAACPAGGKAPVMANEFLEVELAPDRPVVRGCLYKPAGIRFEGAVGEGVIVLNGEAIPWDRWVVDLKRMKEPAWQGNWFTYRMTMPGKAFRFDICFLLVDCRLVFQLKNIQDPAGEIRTIAWKDLPLVSCKDPEYEYWRFRAGDPDPASGGKQWTYDERGRVGDARPGLAPSIHGVIFRPDQLAVFGFGNYPLFPYLHAVTADHRYTVGPNEYRYRVRNRVQPPLQFEVVFLKDLNRDGRSDFSDYALWVNRRIPDLDPFYLETLWYKIFLASPDFGTVTSLKEAEEITGAIANITGGIPQSPHLVGWQYKGHDTFYPSYGDFNTDIGGAFALRELDRYCTQHNALLSYHCNIDDAYRNSLDWNDSIILTNMEEFGVSGSVSHCLDVESGQAFRRLDQLFRYVQPEKTLQIDNTRVGVVIPGKGIGLHEELIAGLMPIAGYFRDRGVTLTTEGQNGLPFDLTKVFAGVWHSDYSQQALPLWHRKLVGGGRGSHTGHLTRMDYALGSSIHQDVSYRPLSKATIDPATWERLGMERWCPPSGLTMSYLADWDLIVQAIYEGTFLYHYFLEREMTDYREIPGGLKIEYNFGETVMTLVNDELTVRTGETVVAHNEERFIPRGRSVYAYSREGGTFEWVLPAAFAGGPLTAERLGREGSLPFSDFTVTGRILRIRLDGTAPVKLSLSNH